MKILVDTSILIDFIRQSNNPVSPFAKIVNQKHDIAISDITLAELYSGKFIWESKDKMFQLKSILKHIPHYPTNAKIAELSGQIRALHHIALLDAIIAATAITHKLPLATLNTKDFFPIPYLKLVPK
jgi:predicted nucleic acid-binding protein